MSLTRLFLAGVAAALLCLSGAEAAPVDLSDRIEVVAANPRTTLDRATGRTISAVDVTLTNKGTRPVETPLHALVFFTAQTGSLSGLQVTGANGGLGVAPYQTFFYDLSGAVQQRLAPGGSVSFVLRFSPARNAQVSYRVVPFGVLNQDPVANAGGPYAAQVGQAISFTSAASSDPDGDAITVSWNFGDGTPLSDERTPTHAFGATGVFEVTLTVRDARGGVSTARVPAVISPAEEFGLARVRSLDGAGLPLGAVEVNEKLSGQAVTFSTDAAGGYSSLGRGPGTYTWKFSKPGHLDVWRRATLAPNSVTILPNPWLTKQSGASTTISPISDTRLTADGVVIDFPAGTFEQPTNATLTALHAQALPLPLPLGWSPLSQFHLQLNSEPTQPGGAVLTLAGPLGSGEEAVLVRFDATALQWAVVAPLAGTTTVAAPIASEGSFAVVVRDSGPRAPPAPVVGEALEATGAASDISGIAAAGSVTPAVSTPSRDAARVTANARVVFSNPSALSSGLFFRTLVKESYTLLSGGTRRGPDYDTTVFAYHRPGDALAANFPMRPQLLLGPEELLETTVRAEVLTPGAFAGGVIGATGGQLADDGTRVIVPAGALPAVQAVELGSLDPKSFTGLTGGVVPARAFAVNIGALTSGQTLAFDFGTVEPNAFYVLGRAVSLGDASGLAPVERFVSDAEGRLTSAEPTSGERLPGARGSGEYVLLKVAGPLTLVHGTVGDTTGTPGAGLIVQVAGQPWVFISGADGSYRTLVPVGATQLIVTDPRDGNQGFASINVSDPAQAQEANVSTAPTGPRVASIEPAAGATGVRTVTPIVVRFSERILLSSFGAAGLVLRAADGSVVPGSLSLNSAATVATLLPTNPLAPEATYTIEVSAGITDVTNLPIEGERMFTFTTAGLPARGEGAQLVIYEPGATNIPAEVVAMIPAFTPQPGSSIVVAHGNQGAADPGVPVILVNQDSGETSTVLSKPDGSFAGFIDASEEDFVSAVFVNANGTRIEVPATRQLFDDGRVGLYRHGGILEAESDNGPVEVFVEPGAIPNRTKFKIEPQSLASLLARIQDALPTEGKVIGGLKITTEGDDVKEPLDLSFPVNENDLPPGADPAEAGYVVGEPIVEAGVKVFNILEEATYADGKVRTNSPPFPGLSPSSLSKGGLDLFLFAISSSTATFTGKVGKALEGPGGQVGGSAEVAGLLPLPGALVSSGAAGDVGLRPGLFVARTNSFGFYALKVPVEGNGYHVVRASSTRFPGRVVRGGSARVGASADIRIVNFAFPVGRDGSLPDTSPPTVTVTTPAPFLPVGATVEVRFNMLDGSGPPTMTEVEVVPGGVDDPTRQGSYTLGDGSAISAADVEFDAGADETTGGLTSQRTIRLKVDVASRIAVRAVATDDSGNSTELVTYFFFSSNPPPPSDGDLAADPADTSAPRVVTMRPGNNEMVTDGRVVTLVFSEAISQEIENGQGISVLGAQSGARPFVVRLAPDRLSATLEVPALPPGEEVTVSVVPPVRDLRGNTIEPFLGRYRTAPTAIAAVPGVTAPVATFVLGSFAYTVERGDANFGQVRVHRLGATPQEVGSVQLPAFPRAAGLIERFAFRRRPGAPIEDKALLVVAGGLLGEDRIGQWLRIIDLSNPAQPTVLASKLAVPDFAAAVTVVKIERGAVHLLVNTPEGGAIYIVDLQTFILQANYTDEDFAANPNAAVGVDLTSDGDYVDAGEKLPVPPAIGLAGLIGSVPLLQNRFVNDFDPLNDLVAIVYANRGETRGRFDVSTRDGELLRAIEFAAGENPLRVLLEPNLTLFVDGARRNLAVAGLVTVGNELRIYDVGSGALVPGEPRVPPLVQTIRLPAGSGSITALVRDGAGNFVLATGSQSYVVQRGVLGELAGPLAAGQVHPALGLQLSLAALGRNFGAGSAWLVGLVNGQLQAMARPVEIEVVTLPSRPVFNAAQPVSVDTAAAIAAEGVAQQFVLPASLKAHGADFPAAVSNPPPPNQHLYAFISAPGDLGREMELCIESLDRAGRRLTPRGPLVAPVILTALPGSAGVENLQPAASAHKAYRLSDDPASPYFNLYVSQPFLLVREGLSEQLIAQIASVPGRQALQLGDQLRLSIEKVEDLTLLPDLDSPAPALEHLPPQGLTHVVPSFCADFVDSANPSPRSASPQRFGVWPQSGEFSFTATDYSIEGRGTPLVLMRSYESQSHYNGPFGRGWDFNWNRRLAELPSGLVPPEFRLPLTIYGNAALDEVVFPGDVLLQTGDGDVRLYRRIGGARGNQALLPAFASDPAVAEFGWQGRVVAFFAPPRGSHEILAKLSDGTYVLLDPMATRTYFGADGRLQKIVPPYSAGALKLFYRPDGKLDRVEGDRGISLEFGYYGRTTAPDFRPLDRPAELDSHLGLIARVKAGPQDITYRYDANNSLTRVIGMGPFETVYGYDAQPPHQLKTIGRGDGTDDPRQTITYVDGLVRSTTVNGETFTFTGEKTSAADRLSAGESTVKVTSAANGRETQIGIDERGRPKSFAGFAVTVSDDDKIEKVTNNGKEQGITHDRTNPVFRFRGNVTFVRSGASESKAIYDGSAWNRLQSTTSPEGVTTSYAYAIEEQGVHPGRQITVTTGPNVKTMRLNAWGVLEREDAAEGGITFRRQTVFDFAEGLPKGFKLGDLPALEFARGANGVTGVTANGQALVSPSFGSDGQLNSITGGSGIPSLTPTYDGTRLSGVSVEGSDGRATGQTLTPDPQRSDFLGSATIKDSGLADSNVGFEYDNVSRLQRVTTPLGTTQFGYTDNRLTSVTGPGVNRSISGGGSEVTVTEQGLSQTYTFDAEGRVDKIEGQGARRKFTYGSGSRVSGQSIIDLGTGNTLLEETYGFDDAGRVNSVTADGDVWTYDFFPDGSGRSVSINGVEKNRTEKNSGGVTTGVSILGGAFSVSYSDFHPISLRPGVLTWSLGEGLTTSQTSTFDDLGRAKTVARGGLAATQYDYDSFGHLTKVTDPDGVASVVTRSPTGFPLSHTFSDGTSVSYNYRANRSIESIGDMQFGIDSAGLSSSVTYPDGVVESYDSRNALFQPDLVTVGGVAQVHTWANGRLERIQISSTNDDLRFEYDGLGRRTAATLNNWRTDFGYSRRYGLVSETSPLGRWRLEFNGGGAVSRETYPSGQFFEFAPDQRGLATAIPQLNITSIAWADLTVPKSFDYAGGIRAVRHFDPALRIQKFTWEKDGQVIAGFEYSLTAAGRVNWEKRIHEANTFDVFTRNAPTQAMRVESVVFGAEQEDGSGNSRASVSGIAYDGNSEIDWSGAQASGGGAPGIIPGPNENITRTSQGSIQTGPVWVNIGGVPGRFDARFFYDGLNRLRKVERLDVNGDVRVTVEYRRDGLGRIIEKTVAGPVNECVPGTTRYAWRGRRLIEEYRAAGDQNLLTRRYVWLAGDLVALQSASTPGGALTEFIPLTTFNGSIAGYLRGDGLVFESIRYGLYGLPEFTGVGGLSARSGVGGSLLFQGTFFDEETGLYDFGRRTLHPVLGAFLQRDPQMYRDSRAMYLAFNGDPATFVDTRGAKARWAVGKSQGTRAVGGWESFMDGVSAKMGELGKEDDEEEEKEDGDPLFDLLTNGGTFNFSRAEDDEEEEEEDSEDKKEDAAQAKTTFAKAKELAAKGKKVYGAVSEFHEANSEFIEAAAGLVSASKDLARYDYVAGKHIQAVIGGASLPASIVDQVTDTRRSGLVDKISEQRWELGEKSVALAKLGLSGIKEVFKTALKPKKGEAETRNQLLANGVIDATSAVLDGLENGFEFRKTQQTIDAALKAGQAGQIEATVGGIKVAGPASSAAMRGLVAVQVAKAGFDAGFSGGQALTTIGLTLTDPAIARDYKAATQTFKKNGGFNLALLGGIIASYTPEDPEYATIAAGMDAVVFNLNRASDFELSTVKEKALEGLGLDGFNAGPKDSLYYYYQGLDAP